LAASEAKKQITWAIDSGFTHLSAISAGVPTLLAGGFHFLNSSRRKSETFTIIRSFFR
jgi:hypothetical protein